MKRLSIVGRRAAATIMAALGLALLTASDMLPAVAAEPPTEWDGLARVPSKRLDLVYVRPGASLAGYKRVRLDAVEVAFDKNWNPNRDTQDLSRRLSKADMEAIKTDLAGEFRKVFKEELGKGGYALADGSAEDILRVTAAIIDLYITAPAKQGPGRSRTYVADAGRMTLVAELRDSVTGQLLARVVDRQQASSSGAFQVSSRVSNSGEARLIIAKWAGVLRKGLDEVNGKPETK